MTKKIFLTTVCSLFLFLEPILADSAAVDFLRSTGKIYSVVAVVVAIFLGIIFYLYRLDKKLTNLENQIKDEQ